MIRVLRLLIIFLKHVWGTINHPYTTYRKLAKGEQAFEVVPLFFLIGVYFLLTTVMQKGLNTHPLLLTLSAGKLVSGFVVSFAFVLGGLMILGKLGGGRGSLRTLFLPWSYSLLPTITWFLATSIFYIVLPPPRTPSFAGQLFSILFLVFSLVLFFWKLVLYYLTLRFGMRLTLLRIAGISTVLFPLLFLYSIGLYRLGIFRVPFI